MAGCFSWAVKDSIVTNSFIGFFYEGLLKIQLWDFSLLVFLEATKRWQSYLIERLW